MTTSSGVLLMGLEQYKSRLWGEDGYLSQVMGLVNQAQNDKSSVNCYLIK